MFEHAFQLREQWARGGHLQLSLEHSAKDGLRRAAGKDVGRDQDVSVEDGAQTLLPACLFHEARYLIFVGDTAAPRSRGAVPLQRLERLRLAEDPVNPEHLAEELAFVSSFGFGEAVKFGGRFGRQ